MSGSSSVCTGTGMITMSVRMRVRSRMIVSVKVMMKVIESIRSALVVT